jgi:hypothetical protein
MIAHRSDTPVLAIGFVRDFGFRENRKAAAGYHEGQLLAVLRRSSLRRVLVKSMQLRRLTLKTDE